jgi:hypothetical protein
VFDEVVCGLVETACPGFGLHSAAVSPLQASNHGYASPRLWKMPHTVTRPLWFVNDKLVEKMRGNPSEDGK